MSKIKEDNINEYLTLHIRQTQFFISNKYTKFQDQITLVDRTFKASNIKELSLKLCGYGYFPQIKERLIANFLIYLNDALALCQNLSRIKIIFNGFNVSQGQMTNLLKALNRIIDSKKPIRSFQLCTTNLRGCKKDDVKQIFRMIQQFGGVGGDTIVCEQINIQMADWQFNEAQGKYLSNKDLYQFFGGLAHTAHQYKFKFKKFRLQLSSCYMDIKSAYYFLKDVLKTSQLIGNIVEKPNIQQQPGRRKSSGNINTESIEYYLKNFDTYYLQPTYNVKKSNQNYSLIQKDKHQQIMERMQQQQDYINTELVKHPKEFVMQLRVNQFHKKVTQFITELVENMPNAQEFHIDLRNWNPIFQMGVLQKSLEKKVISTKQEVSYMSKRNFRPTQVRSQENKNGQPVQGIILKTIYMM